MRILIVDDYIDFHGLIETLVTETLGPTQTICASTIADANAQLATHKFDVVICDYQFPEGTAAEIFRAMQASGSTGRFVLFSSMLPDSLSAFSGSPFFAAVSKTDFNRLRAVLRAALPR